MLLTQVLIYLFDFSVIKQEFQDLLIQQFYPDIAVHIVSCLALYHFFIVSHLLE